MPNSEITNLLKYILFIYLFGFAIYLTFFKNIFSKNNLFFNTGISWILGNLGLIIGLYVLTFTQRLNLISQTLLEKGILFTIVLILINWFFFSKKIFHKLNVVNLLTFIFLIFFFKNLIIDSLISYLISWDAMAMWFLKAKTFFYSNGIWDNNFYLNAGFEYSNKPYPIGFPLIIAAFFRIINFINDQIIQLYFLVFFINLVLIFFGFIKKTLNKLTIFSQILITLSLFALPNFMIYAHSGYGDMLVSLGIALSIIIFIYFLNESDKKNKFNYLTLLLCSTFMPVFIKNEGIPICIVLNTISILIYAKTLKKEKLKNIFLQIINYLLLAFILIFPLVMWELFKKQTNMVFYLDNATIIAPLSKIKMISFHFMDEFLRTSYYSVISISLLLILVAQNCFLIVNRKFQEILPFFVVLLQLFAYMYVYLITTVPLKLQLDSSYERLFLQILPALYIIAVYNFKNIDNKLGE